MMLYFLSRLRSGRREAAVSAVGLILLSYGLLATAGLTHDSPTESAPAAPAIATAEAQFEAPAFDAAPGYAGMRVAIDPETGALGMPAPDASKAAPLSDDLANMLSRSSEGLEIIHYPNGMRRANLDGRFMSVSVAHIDADGTLHQSCVDHQDAAHAAMHGCNGDPAVEVK